MKVKGHPDISKECCFIVGVNSNEYQKRKAQLNRQQRLREVEKTQNKHGEDIDEIKQQLNLIINLLQGRK